MSSDSDDKNEKAGKTARTSEPVLTTREMVFVPLGEKPPRGQAKYRDPANPFHTWSGRGKRPNWLKAYLEAGRTLADFEIPEKE